MLETALSLNIWKRFVNEGVLDASRLNKRIVESWYRSRDARVNPHLDKGRLVLTNDRFHSQKKKNALLRDMAQPHLERMNGFIDDLGMIALLIDPEGYVLSMTGNLHVRQEAGKINFVEGVRWTEGEVGTNAIGTALLAGEPLMVTGSEHYSIASHCWSCSAAPIRGDDGQIIGVLDVSCPVDRAHPYMLGMVTSVAYAIERDLSIRLHKDEMELVRQTADRLETDQLVVVCSSKQTIVCASRAIRRRIPAWAGLKAYELAGFGLETRITVPVLSDSHGGLIGTCVYLQEATSAASKSVFFPQPVAVGEDSQSFVFQGETGTSPAFRQTLDDLKRVAPTEASVCILGETGTGKELIAQAIHENSPRRTGPFLAVNCGAIPKELMESELFGYAEGAFTGARRNGYKGKFEQANGGTIFLDEIGEIPLSMQAALLRVLQERKVTPVGGTQEVPLDFRMITATHRDLRQLVREGKFREDLYYRLHVYPVKAPPLRERREDIPHLVRFYCTRKSWAISFPERFFDQLMQYDWPGNIRELMNVLERLHIMTQGADTDPCEALSRFDGFRPPPVSTPIEPSSPPMALTLREQIQMEQMTDALQRTNGNVTAAAQMLGVPRSTFYKRLQKFNK